MRACLQRNAMHGFVAGRNDLHGYPPPYLDQMMRENPTDHSREAMRQAVQAELEQLRRLAGLLE